MTWFVTAAMGGQEEFRRALTTMGFRAPREEVDDLFDDIDEDRSGEIDYEEFNKALRQGATVAREREMEKKRAAAGESSPKPKRGGARTAALKKTSRPHILWREPPVPSSWPNASTGCPILPSSSRPPSPTPSSSVGSSVGDSDGEGADDNSPPVAVPRVSHPRVSKAEASAAAASSGVKATLSILQEQTRVSRSSSSAALLALFAEPRDTKRAALHARVALRRGATMTTTTAAATATAAVTHSPYHHPGAYHTPPGAQYPPGTRGWVLGKSPSSAALRSMEKSIAAIARRPPPALCSPADALSRQRHALESMLLLDMERVAASKACRGIGMGTAPTVTPAHAPAAITTPAPAACKSPAQPRLHTVRSAPILRPRSAEAASTAAGAGALASSSPLTAGTTSTRARPSSAVPRHAQWSPLLQYRQRAPHTANAALRRPPQRPSATAWPESRDR